MAKDERLIPLPVGTELQYSQPEGPANYAPMYDDDPFSQGRSIREYLNVIFKHLWLILTLVTIGTSAVAFYMYRLPLQFQAATTLLIQPPKPKQTSKDAINISFGNDQQYWATQIKLLQTPELMRDVVIKLGLYRDPNILKSANTGFVGTVKSIFSGEKVDVAKDSSLPVLSDTEANATIAADVSLTPEEAQRADAYAGILLSGLTVVPVEKTNLVSLMIQNTNPDLAAKVADMTSRVFIENNAKREIEGSEKTLEDLTKSIEDLSLEISQKEQDRINYMKDSNMSLIVKGEEISATRLGSMSAEWLKAESERRRLENEYTSAVAAVNRGGTIPRLNESDAYANAKQRGLERQAEMDKRSVDLNKRVQEIDSKIGDLESKLATLRVKYTDEMPEVQSVIKQIELAKKQKDSTKKEIDTLIVKETTRIETDSKKVEKDYTSDTLSSMKARLEEARKTENQARDTYLRETQGANQQGQAQVRMTSLTNEIETKRGLLNTYTQRQKEVELAISTGRPDNIKITSPAVKPLGPIGPNRTRNIMVAFLVSLAAGIGLSFLMDYLDDSIRTSDDIGRSLGLPTLALIPHTSITEKNKRKMLPGINDSSGMSDSLVALNDNRSATAEAYRHLRTSLLFSSAGKPPQAILVTSSQPSEGKTTTAINTAITLAQSGVEVVIIDCDLRRPRLHQHFNMDNTHGLTNYLSGEKNPENLLKPLPQLPNLKIITSGPIPPNPAELLSSNEMKTLLGFLKGNFKHILVDSPPAISFTDAAILSTLVDGVVIVAMAGKSSTHLIKRFKTRLTNMGARIYGVVLNGIKPNSLEYGYYGYGYGGYNSYYSYDDPNDDTTPRMEDTK
jgi:polysaccharide biosynthesis transport protein